MLTGMQRVAAAIAVYALVLHAVLMGAHHGAVPQAGPTTLAAEHAEHLGHPAVLGAAIADAGTADHRDHAAAPLDCCISCAPGAGCAATTPALAPFLIAASTGARAVVPEVPAPQLASRWDGVTARGPPLV